MKVIALIARVGTLLLGMLFLAPAWSVTAHISVAGTSSCALAVDGRIQCWGAGTSGQLGNGGVAHSTLPVSVSGISNAITVSTGASHACAVLTGGSIKCWGSNANGKLGDGTTTNSATPVSVAGVNNAVAVSAGFTHTCAVLVSGGVQC